MAKAKSDPDRKSKKKLRRTWIEHHPEVRAANEGIERAQKLVEQPKWIADPMLYCKSARDAMAGVERAQEHLDLLVEKLRNEFDQAVGLVQG
jgi:hypothetical protein